MLRPQIFSSIGAESPASGKGSEALIPSRFGAPLSEARPPANDAELREWLQNMIWYHHYGDEEISRATGLTLEECQAARARFNLSPNNRPARPDGSPLLVLPYPGGRHPRIGFLEGAIRPQRETKVSVFTPWDETSYVVVDLPEALWSNLGLTYLAHTHIPTVWSEKGITLERLEWTHGPEGRLTSHRRLPNGIEFHTGVTPGKDGVRMELSLTNGTDAPLRDLRTQVCVLLKGCFGFELQTNEGRVLQPPYAAARSATGNRWVITGWERCSKAWGNEQCPCIHADPQFPDLPPGHTARLHGWLSFYQGTDLPSELKRLDTVGWRAG